MTHQRYKILISGCLLGQRVRYDAKVKIMQDPLLQKWLEKGILLPTCPEVSAGLPTPRPAAEIKPKGSIETEAGEDVTEAFRDGANKALTLALEHKIKIAILTERSPSCGSNKIYDGSFSRTLIDGQGKTCELLRENGIFVFNQFQLQEAHDKLIYL